MTDRAIEQYLDIKVSISVSISIKIYLSNLNIQYLFRPYRQGKVLKCISTIPSSATTCLALSPYSNGSAAGETGENMCTQKGVRCGMRL